MSKISIKTRKGVEHVMTLETYARWMCLMEAIDVIDKTAKMHNIDLDKRTDWIKPLAIQKYINERYPGMLHDVRVEEHLDVETFKVEQELKAAMHSTPERVRP
jgi:desulfoferrodoxin (superoxide reductase-like protein)